MQLSEREKYLLIACIDAELENNRQCDTSLSLAETENIEDEKWIDEALKGLRSDLTTLKGKIEKTT